MTASPDPALIERFAAVLSRARRVLCITGAGISADSGLPTYRGIGGLYEGDGADDGMPIEEALSGDMLRVNPALTWKHIHTIEAACRGARPNGAHEVIAKLQARVESLWVLTQNVDGLHRRAGSRQLIEIHGDFHDLDCTNRACGWSAQVADYAAIAPVPHCPRCGGLVRPRVVLFGETLPPAAVDTLETELARGFDVVVSIGTTSVFPYIAAPVIIGRARGAATVEINPGHSEVSELVGLRLRARAEPTMLALWDALG